jgi:hypothetical protein
MCGITVAVIWLAWSLSASTVPEQGCTFRTRSAELLESQSRIRGELYERVRKAAFGRESTATPPPRRNFIDDEIFSRLEAAKVLPAELSTDEEFCRRVSLDLTGRIPAAQQVREFIADATPNKRDVLVDKLLFSREFVDKWVVWFADLIQATESLSTNARRPQIEGRNSLRTYLWHAISNRKPVKDIAFDLLTWSGNNYFTENGPANFLVLASTAMGPAQDTFDMAMVKSATAFLGMAHYDCITCHDGAGHLHEISLWGQRATRMEAWRMAAHFSRTQWNPVRVAQNEHPLYNSTEILDVPNGEYLVGTYAGNRPVRCADAQPPDYETGRCSAGGSIAPEYRDGSKPDGNWREAYARKIQQDPMFARNFANRLWKQLFGLGLVDPVDTLDPLRLDPRNPPAAPWALQATHPELLEKLAQYFSENNTDLRAFLRLLVTSSAYQLSSRYSGAWKLEHVPLFARHYPRRLDAEEVHDAITAAAGVPGRYTWPIINAQTVPRGTALTQSDPVEWAMQLPDINEPRTNAAVREFMNSFYRGNRDTSQRSRSGSIIQQLNLMNDPFVLTRIRLSNSPAIREIARIEDNTALIDQLWLTFLSRRPTGYEQAKAAGYLAGAQARNAAVEDLAWVLINKIDFLFSY